MNHWRLIGRLEAFRSGSSDGVGAAMVDLLTPNAAVFYDWGSACEISPFRRTKLIPTDLRRRFHTPSRARALLVEPDVFHSRAV